MEPRKMVRLLNLPSAERLPVVAEGLDLLCRNAVSKRSDAERLFDAGRYGSAYLLNGFAAEEAAKALMLLDALRVGWRPDDDVRRLLKTSFYDHHSRLLYAYVYSFPAHLSRDEISNLVDGERDSYYVDGFEGCEFVFRNALLAQREGLLYVDYCADSHGGGQWSDPSVWASPPAFAADEFSRSEVVDLLVQLSRLGVLGVEGLAAILTAWKGSPMEVKWHEAGERNWTVLSILEQTGAARERTPEDERRVLDDWHIPLVGVDLSEKRGTLAEANESRATLWKAFLAREFGSPD